MFNKSLVSWKKVMDSMKPPTVSNSWSIDVVTTLMGQCPPGMRRWRAIFCGEGTHGNADHEETAHLVTASLSEWVPTQWVAELLLAVQLFPGTPVVAIVGDPDLAETEMIRAAALVDCPSGDRFPIRHEWRFG